MRLTGVSTSATVWAMADTSIGEDGLPVRVIKPHTLEKFDRHGQYCGIFTGGMKERWRGCAAMSGQPSTSSPESRTGSLEAGSGT